MPKLTPIPPKRRGRPPLNVDMARIKNLILRGASNSQVRDRMKLSGGTASRACRMIRKELGIAKNNFDVA